MTEIIRKRKKIESEPIVEIKGETKQAVEVKPPVEQEVNIKPEVKPVLESEPVTPAPKQQLKQPKPQQQNKQQPTPKKKSFFERLAEEYEAGSRFVFQLKSGIIVEGVIVNEQGGYIMVGDAIITSKHSRVKTEWVRMERIQIGHFHPFTTDIELIEPKGE